MKNCTIRARRERLASSCRGSVSSKPRRKTKNNEKIRSRSCRYSCRSKRNSNSAVTNELSGQRGCSLQYSPSERIVCLPSCVRVQRESGSAHTYNASPHQSHFAALVDSQPAATSSCTFMTMPSACYLAQQHALLQFPRPARTCRPVHTARCEATCGNGTVGMQGPDTPTGVVKQRDATPAKHLCPCKRPTTLA